MLIEYFLPDNIFTNADLEVIFPKLPADIVEEKVGIRERHLSSAQETAMDLAYQAGKKILEGFHADQIDFLLFCTQSPDYLLPGGSFLLQDKLGLKTSIGSLDFNLGCTGFIYGLAVAKSLIQSSMASTVLLLTAETYSKHIHPRDRANRSIFGDGSAAVIIQRDDISKIKSFAFGTDGSGFDNLIIKSGAMRQKRNEKEETSHDENGNFYSPDHLYMNGAEIFTFTINKVPGLIKEVLEKNQLNFDQIDYFIFHQANKYMLEYLRKKINIPAGKFYNNLLLTGNTVSSTIPIALKDAFDSGLIKKGDKILLAGFGVGYSWGATIIEC